VKQEVVGSRTLCVDGVTLDVEGSQVTGPKGTHHLTPLECRLLRTLMLHPDQVMSRARLMREVWETSYLNDTRTLDVHISWLRRKVEDNPSTPRRIITHRRLGYQLRVLGNPSAD
jgi:DNA-binding response OmpR family regulator